MEKILPVEKPKGFRATVDFVPVNDQVLLRMDLKLKSVLEKTSSPKPTVLPSGTVVKTAKGCIIPGMGFVGTQLAVGDHVAVGLDGPWVNLPLADPENREEIYVVVSEALILGKLPTDLAADSHWYKAESPSNDSSGPSILRPR